MVNQVWSVPMMTRLKQLWQAGDSAKVCAETLNVEFGTSISRNSVIGKINRIGSARDCGAKPGGFRAPRQPKRKEMVPMPQPILHPVEAVFVSPPRKVDMPTGAGAAVLALRFGQCRWPIGDARHDDFHFCDDKAVVGRSYCAHHVAIAIGQGTLVERRAVNSAMKVASA